MKHIWRIIKFTGSLWRYYVGISVLTIFVSLLSLLMPLLSGLAIDQISRGGQADITRVVWLAVGIFAIELSTNFMSNVSGFWGDIMATKLQTILSSRYYEHLMTLPQSFFDTELTGKIINRLNRSIDQITNFMQMMSNNFLQFIFTTVFALIVIAYYSWPIAVLLVALYPIYTLMTIKTSGKWMKYQQDINHNRDLATGRFAEAINQVKVVKSYIQEARELRFFRSHYKQAESITKPQSKLWHTKDLERNLVLSTIFFAVYLLIFVQGARGAYSPGQAVALILYAMQIRIPIFTISFLVENTQRAVADSKDYFEIMALKPNIADQPNAKNLKVKTGNITFDNVNFAYDTNPVIKDFSLTIKPNTKTALVGESGEGKTTLTNLLLRLYEPQSGMIAIDDQNIQSVKQASLRRNIGVVFQDPSLFSGTIRENIAYANPSASDKDIIAAAKAANAAEFIDKLDKGYDAEIGERGLKLSGGQKQRIAIARALLKDAPILILDEATSSLDSRSEVAVQEALRRLMQGRTTIIIAHRLSTIQHVDQIVTVVGGTVDEVGSPTQLARSGGIYAQLLELQHGGEAAKQKLKSYELSATT